jgi:hypothetical protein
VCNVYLPPAQSLVKRGITETDACCYIDDVLAEVPASHRAVVCGDFNARVKNMAPMVGHVQLERECSDLHKCARAPWLLDMCTVHSLHIVNGTTPGEPMPFTCSKEGG